MGGHFRLAPTPSGYLHLGNGVNFAITAALAHVHDGELLLRIDDLDAARVREAYREDIAETLAWMLPGVEIAATVRQSERRGRYELVLRGLRQNGLLFACSCTRRQLAAAREAGGADVNDYPGTCRHRGLPFGADGVAWRMRESGVVVRQKDGAPSYQLASLTDDVDLGVTHLVRGGDLRGSTAIQRALARALAAPVPVRTPATWPAFGRFAEVEALHHALLTDDTGAKLSKSDGAESLRALRVAGASPSVVFAKAAQVMGVTGVTDLPTFTYALRQRTVVWTRP